MKIMKKTIAVLLILVMVLSLCACGSKKSDSDSSKEKDTQSEETTKKDDQKEDEEEEKEEKKESNKVVKEAEVGDILNAPEIEFELEEFYIYFTYADENNETGISTMEIAMNDAELPAILYVTDGTLKTSEVVYEFDDDGNVIKYAKDVFAESFKKDENLSQSATQEEATTVLELLEMLGYLFVDSNKDVKFKKCENDKAIFTGDVYVYEMISDDETIGTVWVDKETGIFVKMIDSDGEEIFQVQSISTSELGIPKYK